MRLLTGAGRYVRRKRRQRSGWRSTLVALVALFVVIWPTGIAEQHSAAKYATTGQQPHHQYTAASAASNPHIPGADVHYGEPKLQLPVPEHGMQPCAHSRQQASMAGCARVEAADKPGMQLVQGPAASTAAMLNQPTALTKPAADTPGPKAAGRIHTGGSMPGMQLQVALMRMAAEMAPCAQRIHASKVAGRQDSKQLAEGQSMQVAGLYTGSQAAVPMQAMAAASIQHVHAVEGRSIHDAETVAQAVHMGGCMHSMEHSRKVLQSNGVKSSSRSSPSPQPVAARADSSNLQNLSSPLPAQHETSAPGQNLQGVSLNTNTTATTGGSEQRQQAEVGLTSPSTGSSGVHMTVAEPRVAAFARREGPSAPALQSHLNPGSMTGVNSSTSIGGLSMGQAMLPDGAPTALAQGSSNATDFRSSGSSNETGLSSSGSSSQRGVNSSSSSNSTAGQDIGETIATAAGMQLSATMDSCPAAAQKPPAAVANQEALRSCPMVVANIVQGKSSSTDAVCSTVMIQNHRPDRIFGWQLVWRHTQHSTLQVAGIKGAVLLQGAGQGAPNRVVNSFINPNISAADGVTNFTLAELPHTPTAGTSTTATSSSPAAGPSTLDWTGVFVNGQYCAKIPARSFLLQDCDAVRYDNLSSTGTPSDVSCLSIYCCGDLEDPSDGISSWQLGMVPETDGNGTSNSAPASQQQQPSKPQQGIPGGGAVGAVLTPVGTAIQEFTNGILDLLDPVHRQPSPSPSPLPSPSPATTPTTDNSTTNLSHGSTANANQQTSEASSGTTSSSNGQGIDGNEGGKKSPSIVLVVVPSVVGSLLLAGLLAVMWARGFKKAVVKQLSADQQSLQEDVAAVLGAKVHPDAGLEPQGSAPGFHPQDGSGASSAASPGGPSSQDSRSSAGLLVTAGRAQQKDRGWGVGWATGKQHLAVSVLPGAVLQSSSRSLPADQLPVTEPFPTSSMPQNSMHRSNSLPSHHVAMPQDVESAGAGVNHVLPTMPNVGWAQLQQPVSAANTGSTWCLGGTSATAGGTAETSSGRGSYMMPVHGTRYTLDTAGSRCSTNHRQASIASSGGSLLPSMGYTWGSVTRHAAAMLAAATGASTSTSTAHPGTNANTSAASAQAGAHAVHANRSTAESAARTLPAAGAALSSASPQIMAETGSSSAHDSGVHRSTTAASTGSITSACGTHNSCSTGAGQAVLPGSGRRQGPLRPMQYLMTSQRPPEPPESSSQPGVAAGSNMQQPDMLQQAVQAVQHEPVTQPLHASSAPHQQHIGRHLASNAQGGAQIVWPDSDLPGPDLQQDPARLPTTAADALHIAAGRAAKPSFEDPIRGLPLASLIIAAQCGPLHGGLPEQSKHTHQLPNQHMLAGLPDVAETDSTQDSHDNYGAASLQGDAGTETGVETEKPQVSKMEARLLGRAATSGLRALNRPNHAATAARPSTPLVAGPASGSETVPENPMYQSVPELHSPDALRAAARAPLNLHHASVQARNLEQATAHTCVNASHGEQREAYAAHTQSGPLTQTAASVPPAGQSIPHSSATNRTTAEVQTTRALFPEMRSSQEGSCGEERAPAGEEDQGSGEGPEEDVMTPQWVGPVMSRAPSPLPSPYTMNADRMTGGHQVVNATGQVEQHAPQPSAPSMQGNGRVETAAGAAGTAGVQGTEREDDAHDHAAVQMQATRWAAIDFTRDILLQSKIGSGAFGTVYAAVWRDAPSSAHALLAHRAGCDASQGSDGMPQDLPVAIKVVPLMLDSANYSARSLDALKQEIQILSQLNHPHVIRFLGAALAPPNVCIVEQLAVGGSLHTALHGEAPSVLKLDADGLLPYTEVLRLGCEIASAMAYLHRVRVVHRDLKAANILLDAQGRALVADFGIAKFRGRTFLSTRNVHAGTPAYMAPEQFEGRPVSEHVDQWAFGVLLWELLTRQVPWADLYLPMQIIFVVGVQGERLTLPARCPPPLMSLITSCWHADPARRPPFAHLEQQLREMLAEQHAGLGSG